MCRSVRSAARRASTRGRWTATFAACPSVSTIAHGDFYVVAWKDANLNNAVDSGDLHGWYAGAVDGTGQPLAAALPLLHGASGVANVAVSVKP